ncbi:hypothetical protein LCGC14_2347710 [marine sediment metagenome]|uniref:Uncharacterized protein n=1 Tax=marine sediment metagenome TaxID=412755 RepID=A0A0F9CAW4_9ZZZZ
MSRAIKGFYGANRPRGNVFFRTKKTQSGEYLQLVKIEGGVGSRRQIVCHSFGRLDMVDFHRLKGTLDRIAEKMGVTRFTV